MRNLILIIIATIGVIAGGFYLFQQSKAPQTPNEVVVAESNTPTNETPSSLATKNEQTAPVDIFYYEQDSDTYSFDHATSERYIGSLDAPVVFYDFSSLSCPHCAEFHNNILPKIKQSFIEKGLVRMVFKPMPLNPSALMGEQLARCLPKKDYYKTISLLYSNQEIWAFSAAPRVALTDLVKLSGITKSKVDECLDAKDFEEALVKATQENAQEYKITSTPSFIFDGGERLVKGVNSYEYFEELLNHYIKRAEAKEAAPQ